MPKQVQKRKPKRADPEPVEETKTAPAADQQATDDLLDEIDEVLEDTLQHSKNAQEFVKQFEQKGGE